MSEPLRIDASLAYVDGAVRSDVTILVDAGGRIESLDGSGDDAGRRRLRYDGLVLPGAVNAHSHAFQILLRGRSDRARSFREWVDRYMYRLALDLDEEGLVLGSQLAFAEMIRNGVTTVGEFFYLHNGPEADGCVSLGNRNSRAVIGAARECGLRIHLLRALYDRNERHGQQRFHEPADEAIAATRELAAEHATDPGVTVSVAPHSLHGATPEGIQAASELAAELGVPFQIHIAEERHDLAYARAHYGVTPGRALQQLGVVSERLCVVHGVWLDGEEIEMLGGAGAKLAYNPISNMALGDGITDIEAMVRAGVTVALGCDGPCANHQVSVFQEMRFAEWLQRVDKLRMNVIPAAATDTGRAESVNYCFEMGTRNGGEVLGLPVGTIAPGRHADLVVVDPSDLSLLPHHGLDPEALLDNVVNAMAIRGAIRHVLIGGREVLRDGRLTLLDEDDLARRAAAWSFVGSR